MSPTQSHLEIGAVAGRTRGEDGGGRVADAGDARAGEQHVLFNQIRPADFCLQTRDCLNKS